MLFKVEHEVLGEFHVLEHAFQFGSETPATFLTSKCKTVKNSGSRKKNESSHMDCIKTTGQKIVKCQRTLYIGVFFLCQISI